MDLGQFAERILWGNTLEDKLTDVDVLTDSCFQSVLGIPKEPMRPKRLQIIDSSSALFKSDRKSQRGQFFPKAWELDHDLKRAEVLHFFANHELLALEIMALVLIKFPDAPKPFRRGLAQTLKDEQKHLRLYISHMERLGMEFGDIPVNGYFWRVLSELKSPYEFVTQMGLTFEQANLDFALHFSELFNLVGDLDCARVMDEVYEDEVRHVRHSLQWFRTWKPKSDSDWQAFSSSLLFPLSPSRAKGTFFSVAARRSAGFDEQFISELKLFNQSKGRPPRIYLYNPAQELEVGSQSLAFSQSALLSEIAKDLESLNVCLAAPDDVLALRQSFSHGFKEYLQGLGFDVPQSVPYDEIRKEIAWDKTRKHAGLVPWGVSPLMEHLANTLTNTLASTLAKGGQPISNSRFLNGADSHQLPFSFRDFVSKSFVVQNRLSITERVLAHYTQGTSRAASSAFLKRSFCQESMSPEPDLLTDQHASSVFRATTFADVLELRQKLRHLTGRFVVLKAPFGSSGHNQIRIEQGNLTENQTFWIQKVLGVFGELVVEPWRNVVAEFSFQSQVLENGMISSLGMVRNISSPNGQYLASCVGKQMAGIDHDARKFLYQSEYGLLLEQTAREVGVLLAQGGYRGPFGIDSYIFRNQDGNLDFNLLGELNLRCTMGRIALEVKKRAQAGRSVVLSLFPPSKAKELLHSNEVIFSQSGAEPLIEKGIFALNDWQVARRVVPLVWIGREAEVGEFLKLLSARV